jgi:hypothetical protein
MGYVLDARGNIFPVKLDLLCRAMNNYQLIKTEKNSGIAQFRRQMLDLSVKDGLTAWFGAADSFVDVLLDLEAALPHADSSFWKTGDRGRLLWQGLHVFPTQVMTKLRTLLKEIGEASASLENPGDARQLDKVQKRLVAQMTEMNTVIGRWATEGIPPFLAILNSAQGGTGPEKERLVAALTAFQTALQDDQGLFGNLKQFASMGREDPMLAAAAVRAEAETAAH